jgi:hypothetical protein
MRGHQEIIKMRLDRVAPKAIFVYYGEDKSKSWANWPKYTIEFPDVEILPIENINQLDLRFAVGLPVHISSSQPYKKVKALHNAFLAAKASRVTTVCGQVLINNFEEYDDYVPE